MYKLKTKKSATKRFKVGGKGRIKHKQSHMSHILTKKSSKRKRQLRKYIELHKADIPLVKTMLNER